jgi:hypothetical protein
MLDDLRNSAASSFEEEENPPEEKAEVTNRGGGGSTFLGMTAPQRFVIALLLFLMTCMVGSLCLVVFEKVTLPFY